MKHVCISLAAALALAVPSFAQSAEETPFSCEVRTKYNQSGTSYSSLAEAVAAVPADGKIHYVSVIGEGPAEITTPITVKAGQNISLYSEKSGITYDIPASLTAPVFTVESGARLTFTRNGEYVYGEGVQGTFLKNYGYVSLANGTFTLDAGDSDATFINHGGAEDNSMKCGATVTVASGTAFRNDGVLTISSGTTTAESGIAVLSNGGTLTLSTSKGVTGSEGAIVVNGGVAKFTKGSYASTSAAPAVRLCAAAAPIEAVFSSSSVTLTAAGGDALEIADSAQVCKVQINRGTFTPAEGKASIRVTHDTEDADITLSVVDGVFNAPIVSEGSAPVGGFILGGTFAAQPDPSLVADGLTFERNADGLYAPTAVAQIGDTTYLTFKEAIVAATPGATVTLLRDVAIPESTPITVYGLTIDLAGHTLINTAANGSGIRLTLADAEGTPAKFTLVGPGSVVAATPLYASGAYNYARPYTVIVDESVILKSTVEGNPQIELSGSARVAATDANVTRLGQGGFKVKDGDAEWLYGNCAGAFLNTPEGGTFTLCQDFKGSSRLEFPIDPALRQSRAAGIVKTATLDLAGHAFTSTLDGNSADLIVVDSGANVTIKGGTLAAIGDLAHVALPPDGGNAALTLEGIIATSSSDDYLIVSNGSTDNIDITVRNSTLTATGKNTVAIYAPAGGNSTVTLDNTIIKSPYGVQVCAGNLVVKGDTRITTTAANVASTKTGDGPIPDGAAISIVNRAGYGNVGTVTIEGTPTLIARGEGATAVAAYTWNDNTQSDWAEASEHVAISGGTFSEKPDNAWFADGFIPVENEDGTFGVAPGSFAAEIDGVKYLTLKEAIAAVPANGAEATTITLLDDVTSAGSLTFTNGQKAILNMNGKTVTFTSGKLQLLTSASLTLTGEGSLVCEASGTGAISIYGNETSQIDLLVDSGVTVEGHYGIALFGNGSPACRNVTVTVKGTVKTSEGGSALYVNGTVNNTEGSVPQIILAEGAKVEAASIGIYAAGYAKWDLAGTINAGNDAISVKSGTFNITGGSYTANGPYVECPVANSNGTEHVGAAIGITTNGDYAKPIVVNITGGDFISTNGYALYEGIAKTSDGTPAAEASAAVIAITGGDFTGSKTNVAVTADISITTAENPRVISGGTFSKPIPEALCALGYVPVDTPNAEGKYTVEHPLFTKVGVQMADGRYKVYDSMYAACYDTEMIAKEGVTGTIIVLEDIEFSSYFRVLAGQNVTFDLNGHTVTCTGGPGFSYAIDWVCNDDITAKPTVTITDSSIGQTGVLRSDGPYLDGLVRMVGGKLNITGGRFVQDVDNPNAQYKDNITVLTEGLTVDPEPGRTVEFSGGTIRVESNAATSVQNFGTAIKGGLFHSSEGRPAIAVAHVTQGLVVSGGSFEGDGKAILISAPATITISGGDFTDDIVAIENAGATVKLSGGVFENAVFTGPGTLDVNPAINDLSMASVDTSLGKLMLAGDLDIGTNRLPNTTVEISASATVSMDAVEKELEIGKVNVFSAGDQLEAPQNLTLTVGNLLATQTLVEPTISVENDTIVLTFLAVPTELVGSEAFLAYLRQEDLGSIVSVTGTTKGGTVALTATELNEALSVFRLTNDLFTLGDTDGGKTLVVAYDFGITGLRVTAEGDLVVTVAAQDAQAKPLAFAEGVTFALRNGEDALETTSATVDGVTTLTVPAVKLPAGNLELTISVAPAAEAETPAE